jgi:peroxiredoxin
VRHLTRLLWTALLAALAGLPGPAHADLGIGRRAPELHVLETWGAPPPRWTDLLGRLVLLEFLRTDCPHCREAVPHLNSLQGAWSERGLRVIGLSFEASDRIEAFRRAHRVAYSVARVETEVFRDYGVSALPRAFLVSPAGRVLWSGRPSHVTPSAVGRWMEQEPPWPTLPPELEPAAALLRAGRLAEGRAFAARCADPTDSTSCAREPARALLTWTDRYARLLAESAVASAVAGEPYEAWRSHDLLARGFGELPPGPEAARAREALLADPARRREIEAGRALEAARTAWRDRGRVAGRDALESVATTYPGTAAGAAAAAMAMRVPDPGA